MQFIRKIENYLKPAFLPLILAVLFSLQNIAFNQWLGIYSKPYFLRLVLVTFGLGAVLYGPALFFRRKRKYIYLFFISIFVSIIFLAQFLFYKYSEGFLQFSVIKYLWQINSIAGTIKILLAPQLLFFVCNIVLVLIFYYFGYKKQTDELILPASKKIVIFTAIILILLFGYKYLLDTEKKEWGNTSRLYADVYDLKSLVGKMGIINFSLEDTFKYALRSNLVTEIDKDFLKKWAENRVFAETGSQYFGTAKNKNIIIIQVESLENAVINKTINGQEITPNLNNLAKAGLYFDNYYAQTGPGNTADAEFSTMNSLYPLPDDVAFINYAKNQYNALPNLLRENGYQTYSFHGDVPAFWNRSNAYPAIGYQKSFNLEDYVITRPVGKGPSDLGDEDLFSQTLPKLKNLKQPFLATVITMSSHTPFILPDDLQTLKIPAELNLPWIQSAYLQSIHYTDKAIGEFIDGLKKDGLYDNSLIFIWGDHGSFTNISSVLNNSENLLPELAGDQVPLIILGAGINKTISDPASHLDVYPTIVNLLGVNNPKTIFGQDLLNTRTPVETHFKLVSGGIDAIISSNLVYQANNDGIFENGLCKSLPDKKQLPITDCQVLYNHQFDTLKASNIIIRGDLLEILLDKKN